MKGSLKAPLYLRVSTDDQTVANQERELRRAAEAKGYEVVAVYKDAGVSGAKERKQRPGLDEALKDAVRARYQVLMSWSVDRLGRSLKDLVATLNELHGCGADLFLHQQAIDTRTPAGKALFGMLGVFAEFERALIQERVRAGLARAKSQVTKSGQPIGRPRVSAELEAQIRAARAAGLGILRISRELRCGVSVVQRIVAER